LRERRARLQAEAQTAAEEAAAEAQLLGAVATAADGAAGTGTAAAGASVIHEVDSDEEREYLAEVAKRRGATEIVTLGTPTSVSPAPHGVTAVVSGLWGRLRDGAAGALAAVTTSVAHPGATAPAGASELGGGEGRASSGHDVRSESLPSIARGMAADDGINADHPHPLADGGAQATRAAARDDDAADDDDAPGVSTERRPLLGVAHDASVAMPHVRSLPTTLGGSAVSIAREEVMVAALNEDKAAVDAAAALLGLCSVCSERRVQCVALPCGHLKLCAECARRMRHCPDCNAVMKRKIKVFVV
jgi:hypothetical protein